jgi:hypothetical protein
METFRKELGAQSTDYEPFPALDVRHQGPSDDGNEIIPEVAQIAPQQNIAPCTQSRGVRRTIHGTRSALRRRTISSAKIIRPLQRKLHFYVEQDNPEHDYATEGEDQKHDGHVNGQIYDHFPKQLSFKQRMKHFTWTWFTMTMATGGIANVL